MDWTDFLQQANAPIGTAIFSGKGAHPIALDDRLPGDLDGMALNKKGTNNPIGEPFDSVFALIHAMSATDLYKVRSGSKQVYDLCEDLRVFVNDASPDSIFSFLAFAALNLGATPPDAFWQRWLGPITRWELTGNAQNPESSWLALASALAHRHFTAIDSKGHRLTEQIAAAWNSVVPFAVEAIRADYDPEDIPANEMGRWLAVARAAFAEEQARYQRRAHASEMWQLSVPMKDAPRRKLVDALFSQEAELTGAMKTIARNDREGSPLGAGFSALVIERPDLRETAPEAWLTVSLDERAGTHLDDLWIELERRETEAWENAGYARPLYGPESREIVSIERFVRVYHEPWYIDPTRTLIGSPKPQMLDPDLPHLSHGSLLTLDEVRDAIFSTLDPMQDFPVYAQPPHHHKPQDTMRLTDVDPEAGIDGRKRVLTAWTPPENTLPHPAGPVDPLPQVALRAMAARTLGIKKDRALRDAPDLEDLETVVFGNGLAVITDVGVYLLDSGRRAPSAIQAARALAARQSKLADELDRIQDELGQSAESLNEDAQARVSSKDAMDRQRQLAALNARVVRARTMLDSPLQTDEAGLHPLKEALSQRWNVRARLQELSEDIAALDASTRAAEELRAYWLGRFAAAGGIGILCGDALVGPISHALNWEDELAGREQILIFLMVFGATAIGAWLLFEWMRGRLRQG